MIKRWKKALHLTHIGMLTLLVLSLLLAEILNILPLPSWALAARPQWLCLLLIFWAVMCPQFVGLGVAFSVGLVTDLLTGTPLGAHALVFVVSLYLLVQYCPQFRHSSFWQQLGSVTLLMLLSLCMLRFLLTGTVVLLKDPADWISLGTSIAIWPVFYKLLRRKSVVMIRSS